MPYSKEGNAEEKEPLMEDRPAEENNEPAPGDTQDAEDGKK